MNQMNQPCKDCVYFEKMKNICTHGSVPPDRDQYLKAVDRDCKYQHIGLEEE